MRLPPVVRFYFLILSFRQFYDLVRAIGQDEEEEMRETFIFGVSATTKNENNEMSINTFYTII